MPCRDVDRRVHVGVAGESAGDALVEGLALAALQCDVPARAAALRRVRGWYLLDPSGGLLLQPGGELAPGGAADAPVQAGFRLDVLARLLLGAFRGATWPLTLARRFAPRLARASLRSRRSRRSCSREDRPGQRSISPVDRAADTATPRSTPTTSPLPGEGTGSGTWANATCQRPERSRVTRNDFTPSGTAQDQRTGSRCTGHAYSATGAPPLGWA